MASLHLVENEWETSGADTLANVTQGINDFFSIGSLLLTIESITLCTADGLIILMLAFATYNDEAARRGPPRYRIALESEPSRAGRDQPFRQQDPRTTIGLSREGVKLHMCPGRGRDRVQLRLHRMQTLLLGIGTKYPLIG